MLFQECFEYDIMTSKIPRLVRGDLDYVKEVLVEYYPILVTAYKYYASFGSIYNVHD